MHALATGLYILLAPISSQQPLYQSQVIAHETTDLKLPPGMFVAFRRFLCRDECRRLKSEFHMAGSRCEQVVL